MRYIDVVLELDDDDETPILDIQESLPWAVADIKELPDFPR